MKNILLALALLLTACSGDRRLERMLDTADSLLAVSPDSAWHYLQAHSVMQTDGSRRQRMRFELLRATAQNKAYIDFTTDSVMKEVVDYYDHHGTANEQLQAHYLLGCVYRDLGDAPRAIGCFLDAVAKADTTVSDCDFGTTGHAYSQMANMYHRQLLLNNEIEARKQSFRCMLLSGDTLPAISDYKMIAGPYMLQNKSDSAEIILKEAIRLYENHNYKQEALKASMMLMHLYAEQPERMSSMKELIDRFEAESNLFDESHKLPPSKRQYYYYKGRYFEMTNQLDSAELCYRKIYYPNINHLRANPMYRGLLSVFKKKCESDSIAKYADLYCMSVDSSTILKDRELTAQMTASYNYSRFRELSNRKTIEAKNLQMQMAVFVFIAFVAVLLLIFAYFHQVSKKRMLRQRMNAKYTADILSFLKICSDLEEIKNKDEKRRQELEAEMTIIKQSLSEVQEDQKSPDQWDVSLKLLEAPIVRHFHQMAAQGNTVSDEKWQELRSLCNVALPGFLESLAATGYYPNLVETQICLLIKLRFLMSEISTIVRLSPSALSNKRVRMLKKMYRTDGSSSDFDEKIRLLRFGSS